MNRPLTVAITSDDAVMGVAGCRVYVVNLVEHLAQQFPDDRFVLVSGRAPKKAWQPDAPNVRTVQLPFGFRVLQRGLWPFLGLPPIDWFTGPIDVLHNTLTTTAVPCRVPAVVTLHDFYPERFPDRYGWRDRRGRSSLLSQAESGLPIAISAATAAEAASLAGFERDGISVIHHGVPSHRIEAEVDVRSTYRLEGPFFLAVSRIDPRKNLTNLIAAYDRYRARGGSCSLVIAGGAGTGAEEIKDQARALGDAKPVHFLGHVPDGHLSPLIRAAHAYVYPSTYEGFGLPLLEAMSERVPIATSNTSSIPEIAGDSAVFFDPSDIADIAATLDRVDSEEDLRSRLVASMPEQLAKFDWAEAARQTRAVYARAAASAR